MRLAVLYLIGSLAVAGQTDDRIARYQKLAKERPGDAKPLNLLAKAYLQKVRETTDFSYLERASRLVEGVLASHGGNYEAMRLRSEIDLERHNFSQVAEYSEELTKLAPGDPWNWGTLGDASMELGQYERAAAAYQKMVTLQPGLSSLNRLSYYLFVTGNADGAIAAMKQAIAAGSTSPEHVAWCLADLGQMQVKTGKVADARTSFESALKQFPGYHPAYGGLGKVDAAQGKIKSAIDNYKRAQAAVPLPEYAAALHDLYLKQGLKAEAKKQLDLIDLVDQMARAAGEKTDRKLAIIYADQGRKLDRALELVQEELKVRQDVYTYDALAWVLFKNGRHSEAREAMKRAMALNTPEPSFRLHAAAIDAAP